MRALVVCSGNSGNISPFISEQVESLKKYAVKSEYYLTQKKGVRGYILSYFKYRVVIKKFKPNIVLAHYGLSGLMATFQCKVPVIITFLGSDINNKKNRFFSLIADRLAKESIFVSQKLADQIKSKKANIVPFGANTDLFYPIERNIAREKLGLDKKTKTVLFSSAFHNPVKNYPLAKKAINLINDPEIKLLELQKYTRKELSLMLNSCDCLLMTSFNEGSPQIIKEAMACNTPIVSTDVGDVKELFGNLDGHYISNSEKEDVAKNISLALDFSKKTKGRERILELALDSESIAKRLITVYKRVLKDY